MYRGMGEAGTRALRVAGIVTVTLWLVAGYGVPRTVFAQEAKGEEAKGEEAKGEEAKGEEAKGEEAKGEEAKGEEAKGEEGAAPLERFTLSAALESYRWQEFNSSGTRLLEESGPHLRLTAALDNMQRVSDGGVYRLSASVYGGQVDYDGQTQDGTPATTNTNYFGCQFEGFGGWRFGGTTGFDVLGGIAVNGWRRDLLNGRTVTGVPVQGYTEDYLIALGKLGFGGYYQAEQWRAQLYVGAQRPLATYERVYLSDAGFDDDVTLHPGKDTSGFVRLQVDLDVVASRAFVALYYDGLRLKQSDTATVSSATLCGPVGICTVTQPESRRDIVGLEVGLGF
jgi:hypothetical protein